MICPNCGWDNLPGNEDCDNCKHDLTALDRPVAGNRVEKNLMEEQVQHLNKHFDLHPPHTMMPGDLVRDAIQVLLKNNIGAVLVVDEQGKLQGILSERDLLKKMAGVEDSFASQPISKFMTAKPETVTYQDPLAFVLHKMDVGGYRHLPVVHEGKPVGIISVRDMLRYITRISEG